MAIDLEQLKADVADGTPGDWTAKRAKIGGDYGILSGRFLLAETFCDIRESSECADSESAANARRIARLPELEAAHIAQAAEIARMQAVLEWYADQLSYTVNPRSFGLLGEKP